MNDSISVSLDKIVSVSQARANLSKLLDEVKDKSFLVLSRRYKPQAVLVDLQFLSKLMKVYQSWQRKQDFTSLEEIRLSTPSYPEKEVRKDIAKTLSILRKARA